MVKPAEAICRHKCLLDRADKACRVVTTRHGLAIQDMGTYHLQSTASDGYLGYLKQTILYCYKLYVWSASGQQPKVLLKLPCGIMTVAQQHGGEAVG